MVFHHLDEAFAWIDSFTNLERSGSLYNSRTYQLDRMRFLAAACGNPELACRTVHLAGTKGKGSTAVLIAESLHRAGLRDVDVVSASHHGELARRSDIGPLLGMSVRFGDIPALLKPLSESALRDVLTTLGFVV